LRQFLGLMPDTKDVETNFLSPFRGFPASFITMRKMGEHWDVWFRVLRTTEERLLSARLKHQLIQEYMNRTLDAVNRSKETIRRSDEFLRRVTPISK
jgi:hypothetical protein